MTVDVVRKEFMLPLLVHILASERLRQDVDYFIERGHTSRKGSVVPIASPGELLIRLLVNQPSILEKIATGGDTVLGSEFKSKECRARPFTPGTAEQRNSVNTTPTSTDTTAPAHIQRLWEDVTAVIDNLRFYHTANGNRELFVGASQENWTGLPAIGRIRREDRDYRLSSHIPLTTRAFNALRQAEEDVVLPVSMRNLPKKLKGYQVRIRAIAAMRNSHPDFLGRTTEVGQAFDKTMQPQQCCYACKGMMGYRIPAEFFPRCYSD
ncbi:MAG: hypothetical protein M1839_007764 [Geoglossum umbratile]|nr:MAG: hypothetical protein M1839_007764 [Geoglossum umbratile]